MAKKKTEASTSKAIIENKIEEEIKEVQENKTEEKENIEIKQINNKNNSTISFSSWNGLNYGGNYR